MENEPWHLSRTISLSSIFGFAVQTIVVIWFVAGLNNDVANNKSSIIKLESKTEALYEVVQSQAVASARMEENLKAIRNAVELMAGIRDRRTDNTIVELP